MFNLLSSRKSDLIYSAAVNRTACRMSPLPRGVSEAWQGSYTMHWDFALILIFLGVVVPWLGRRRIRHLMQASQTSKMDRLTLYASTMAFQWLAAGVILWRTGAHHIAPAQLGLAVPNGLLIVAISVLLSAFLLAIQLLTLRRLTSAPDEIRGTLPQLALKIFPQDHVERLAFLALVATVAVCEELIYRGFVQRVLEDWFGSLVVVGVLGSAALFALAHLYQGRRGLGATFILGAIFSVIRAWTGSLVPPLAAHFAVDLMIGLAAPHRLRAALARTSSGAGEDER
jgi:membrane protease YdiL (CAAX protease family)